MFITHRVMIRILIIALTLLTALGSGVVAGIWFAFSAFVMQALGRIPPEHGINAMQSINIVVLNPLFLTLFLGTGVCCVILAVIGFFNWGSPAAIYLIIGSVLYLVASILVTSVFNVPLNDGLAAVAPDSAEGAATWARYLPAWLAWNHVRTVGTIVAAASFLIALSR